MSNDVEAYYNANTRRFLRLGKGGTTGAIHRAVWAPGVSSQAEAMHYVDRYVADTLQRLDPAARFAGPVLDLGCGVGATVAYVRGHTGRPVTGMTLSRVQAEMAQARYPDMSVLVGDFGDRDRVIDAAGGAASAAGAYMIESLCHAPDAANVLSVVAAALAPGAPLIVCDDLAAGDDELQREERTAERYMRGWHVRTFQTPVQLVSRALAAGFDLLETVDLTSYIANNRPRDRAIRFLMAIAGHLPIRSAAWDNVLGGNALQELYRRGAARYMIHTFTRLPS